MTTASKTNAFINLNDYDLISCQGPDATRFLQGQLTCDMNNLNEAHGQLAAYCNHKGRVLATLHLIRSKEGYYLLLPPSMGELFLSHIKPYAAFSKVAFEPLNDWHILGYCSETSLSALPDAAFLIRMPGTPLRHIIIGPQASLPSIEKIAGNDTSPNEPANWAGLNITAGFAAIYPETSGLFTPQMIRLEQFDAVSFKKGCYVGQEVVARTQHLGKLKRHLHRATLFNETTKPKRGDKLTNEKGEAIGTIAEVDQETQLLAVIEDRALENPIYFGDSKLQIA